MTREDADLETVVEYDHISIGREQRDGEPDRFHVEDALERLKSFESKSKAELYVDVYTVVGGFREEKTGERGVPPAIAAAREDVLMAYLTAQPTMSLTWTARFFNEDESVIRRYVNGVQGRAAERRDGGATGDLDTSEEYPTPPPDPDLIDYQDDDQNDDSDAME